MIGGVCQVAVDILDDVSSLRDKADDVIEAGRRVADVLEFIEMLERGALQQLAKEQRAAVENKIKPLHSLLEDFRACVKAFGKRGFLKRVWSMRKHTKTLAKLDKKITQALESLKDTYRRNEFDEDEELDDMMG